MEILIFIIPQFRMQIKCTDDVYRFRYILIPTILNVSAVLVAFIMIRSSRVSQRLKNYSICGMLLVICMVIQIFHGIYASVLSLPSLAIFISAVFAENRLTYTITVISLISTLTSYIVGHKFFDESDIFISNYIIASAIIIIAYFCSNLLLRFIYSQLHTVKKGHTNEERLINKMRLDPLTGLYNRGGMDSIMDELIKNYDPEHALYLLMIDIDNFKSVNDTYGHQNGDTVLRTLAQVILDMGRKDIIPCRYGGEEVCVMFRNMDIDDAIRKSNKILSDFRNVRYDFSGDHSITFSAGFVQYEPKYTKDEWIKIADTRLYFAKQNGKNRVISIPVEETTQII
ncbi:MAG: GGDEF domain-containing protein [Lachnospiraceae bacterium]|nr:GGDEF domain-containing protein [Lachnospiraceae bacterium]